MSAIGWCARCGVTYVSRFVPQCECAGDPPVDKTGAEHRAYLARVARLYFSPVER